jgi:hypothetical protein
MKKLAGSPARIQPVAGGERLPWSMEAERIGPVAMQIKPPSFVNPTVTRASYLALSNFA